MADKPTADHRVPLKRVFRYLKGTTKLGITMKRRKNQDGTTTPPPLRAWGYVDASYANAEGRRSTREDNQSMIAMANNPLNFGRTKHIDVR